MAFIPEEFGVKVCRAAVRICEVVIVSLVFKSLYLVEGRDFVNKLIPVFFAQVADIAPAPSAVRFPVG